MGEKSKNILYEDDKFVAWEEYDPAQHIFDDEINLWVVNEKVR
jgi:hypothetical protein